MALKRFGRDVAPFKPQVVVFSFAFAEAMSQPLRATPEERDALLEKLQEDTKRLCDMIREIGAQPLFWIPNPIYTDDGEVDGARAVESGTHSLGRAGIYDAVIHAISKACASAGVLAPIDARSLFIVNGEQSARRWMANWFMHNELGASNIASWIKDQINDKGLLQGASKIMV